MSISRSGAPGLGLPFSVRIEDARTGVIVPLSGLALPKGLLAGERFDLGAQPRSTRIAIAELNPTGQLLPSGKVYGFAIHHGLTAATVSVRATSLEASAGQAEQRWLELFEALLTGAISLAAVWRGRTRTAAGLALFATTFLAGRAIGSIPWEGVAGLAAVLGAWVLYLFVQASEALLDEVHMRESTLLDALRAVGAASRV